MKINQQYFVIINIGLIMFSFITDLPIWLLQGIQPLCSLSGWETEQTSTASSATAFEDERTGTVWE